jgi:hypothetical protein
VREQGKKCGALLFSLNFLWLLSLFQDKESDNKEWSRIIGDQFMYFLSLLVQRKEQRKHSRFRCGSCPRLIFPQPKSAVGS